MINRNADDLPATHVGDAPAEPKSTVTVLIPAFQPDPGLLVLVRDLIAEGLDRIILVDDGSRGEAYDSVFAAAVKAGCTVLRHTNNLGQGRAIKSGLEAILASGACGSGVVLADANGDFSARQIRLVADALMQTPEALILGTRRYSGHIPIHRRFGHWLIRQLFASIHGNRITDLQTGLRGLPASRLALFASLPGEGYDYGFNMLLAVRPNEIPLRQIPIPTAYHSRIRLHPLRRHLDIWRMSALLLRFLASSLLTTGLEYALFFTLMQVRFPGRLLISVIVSKTIGALTNFWINYKIVFCREQSIVRVAVRYAAVQALVIAGSYSLISLLHRGLGLTTFLAKLLSDILLYLLGFFLQREWVYRTRRSERN